MVYSLQTGAKTQVSLHSKNHQKHGCCFGELENESLLLLQLSRLKLRVS